jgi:site-specific recombinase XerD
MSHNWHKDHWIIDYRPDGRYGQRKRLHLPPTITQEQDPEVAALEANLKITARIGKSELITPTNATVDDLFQDYLKWYRLHRSERTYHDLSLIYDAHISHILGKIAVESLGIEHFDLYQKLRKMGDPPDRVVKKERIGKIVSNRTVNKELDYFSGFLKWCRDHKKIKIAPIKYAKLPYKAPLPMVLTVEEVLKIIEVSSPFYRALFLCLYSMGLRFSEARFLKQKDLDFENCVARVQQKGGSYKILPLYKRTIKAIKELGDKKPDDYLFLTPRRAGADDRPEETNDTRKPILDIRCAIRKACKLAGIQKKVNPHLFRHSWATHLLDEETNLRVIQRYLGHTQISTTEIYTHVSMGHLRRAGEAVFAGTSTQNTSGS